MIRSKEIDEIITEFKSKFKELYKLINPLIKKHSVKELYTKIKIYSEKKDKTNDQIIYILSLVKDVKKEMLEWAIEEKGKPWIGERFDSAIDDLAKRETDELRVLEENLQEYTSLMQDIRNNEDLDNTIDMLLEEEKVIEERENKHNAIIESMTKETLKERLARPSSNVPPIKTSNKISWSNIVKVARGFGAWVESAGSRPKKIFFPNAPRPIPISKDVHSGAIARQMITCLASSLPKHKLPTKSNLDKAFKKGNIRLSA